ncbi:molybdenum cofactor biosynthesis protein MoaE [Paenibacillus sp. IB182496]|uniref:Molybdopterin synthase catalytic subunit n=1 Tax=Paenibacillus sabuli TaxID=2772509 RepID=A0A927GTV1_9BACL|nr:molybdenum cofactor biosynthesis protein MoaE [Paenibacillus sabuli]MBD2848249.1 molybdenum cofactor biosynthesis protein MoaE [Paenibacillus sabuli]
MKTTYTIQLFAGLGEQFGTPVIRLALDAPSLTVRELKRELIARYPEAAEQIRGAFVARNQAYAEEEESVGGADELALLPPVSGGQPAEEEEARAGAAADLRYEITHAPLSIEAVTARVIDASCGATLTFVGTTREWTGTQRTVRLEYEAYAPMALRTLRQIGDEVAVRWPGTRSAISHRLGVVELAETSVVIAVAAPHRDACYEASRYAIERLKQIVPIWKKEIWADGSEWKGHQQGPWDPTSTQH